MITSRIFKAAGIACGFLLAKIGDQGKGSLASFCAYREKNQTNLAVKAKQFEQQIKIESLEACQEAS